MKRQVERKVVTGSVCMRRDLWEKVDNFSRKLDVSRSKALSIILTDYFERGVSICLTKEEREAEQH